MILNSALAQAAATRILILVVALAGILGERPDPSLSHLDFSSDISVTVSQPSGVWRSLCEIASFAVGILNDPRLADFAQRIAENSTVSTEGVSYKIASVSSVKVSRDSTRIWPVRGRISSGFGIRRHPVTKRRGFHHGIDVAARSGTAVSAPLTGRVISAGYAGSMGRSIIIETDGGELLYFGHLSKISVKRGHRVKRGQTIGLVGSSGRATGPHLHFAVKKSGKFINPLSFLP